MGVQTIRRMRAVSLETAAVVRERNLTFLAGAIAYAAFVSLVPLLVLVFVVASALRGPATADAVVSAIQGALSPNAADLLRGALTNRTGVFGTSILGVVLLAWSALKTFRGLNVAFGVVYGTGDASFVESVRDGTVALASLSVAAVALVGVSAALALVVNRRVLDVFGPLFLLIGLAAAFLPVYYVLPDVPMTLRDALPGAGFAAVGWLALGVVFRVYVSVAGASQAAYGVLGGVMVLLTWLYLAALIVLVGAVVNAVVAGRVSGSVVDALA